MKYTAKMTYTAGLLCVWTPLTHQTLMQQLADKSAEKHSGYLSVNVTLPRRPRTTGEKSQNHEIHRIVDCWVAKFGQGHETTYHRLKEMAMDDGEYPGERMWDGTGEPVSETVLDTVQASAFIEWLNYASAEWGVSIEDSR